MLRDLTERQQAIYEFVVERVRARGIPPTLTEIARAFDLTSASGISDHLKAIERKGWIRRRPGISRGIEILASDVEPRRAAVRIPVVGSIPTRRRLRDADDARRHLLLDGSVAAGRAFAVRIQLRGLEARGILRGDVLVVAREARPRRGDLVVARIDGQTTVAVAVGGGRLRNPTTDEEIDDVRELLGRVVAVLRAMN